MRQHQLYPSALIEDSLEQHLVRHAPRGRALYLVILLAAAAGLALLPVIRVRVSVRARGIIRPVTEKHEVRSRVSGVVERILAREGDTVHAGDALGLVRATGLDAQARWLDAQAEEQRRLIADLTRLTRGGDGRPLDPAAFVTPRYREEYLQFAGERAEHALEIDRATRDLARVRAMFDRRFAAPSDVEAKEYQLARARSEQTLLVQRTLGRWQSALAAARMQLAELEARAQELREQRALHTIRAPVGGAVDQVAAISPGSYVQAGEQIAVISPDTTLVAEVYVAPRDIGLLRAGTAARLLIDAFDHAVWGSVSGRVAQVSDDFLLLDQQPMFRVRCTLDRTGLVLASGARGALKKGMTLEARFLVARRSLFQLLYDDVSDWLDPARGSGGVDAPGRVAAGTAEPGGRS